MKNTTQFKLSATQHIVLELGASSPCSATHLLHTLHIQHDAKCDMYDVACSLNLLLEQGYVNLYDDATSWQLTTKGYDYLTTI